MIRKYHNITPCRQIHGITRNSNRGISLTRHQEDKQDKETAYHFKIIAKLESIQSNIRQPNMNKHRIPQMRAAINNESTAEIPHWNRQKPMTLAILGKDSQQTPFPVNLS